MILIVEDDEFKRNQIESVIGVLGQEVQFASSVRDAVVIIDETLYDWVLLDMSLPGHTPTVGGGPTTSRPSGGLELIRELSYQRRNDKVIIITQYPQIEVDGELWSHEEARDILADSYRCDLRGIVLYQQGDNTWKDRVLELVVQK